MVSEAEKKRSEEIRKKLGQSDSEVTALHQLPSVDPFLINSALQNAAKSSVLAKSTAANSGDLFQAHNFDIQIDLNTPSINTNQLQPIVNKSTTFDTSQTNRRTLNLDAYKKKKGLI